MRFQDTFFLVEFDTLELEIFVICWIWSIDPVDDYFVSDKPNLLSTALLIIIMYCCKLCN